MSKMRRAQERMAAARPYAEKLRRTLGHLAQANLEYRHPYITERETKRVAYLVVSTDRGLCGGLNVNAFRATIRSIREWQANGVESARVLIGNQAVGFLKRLGGRGLETTSEHGAQPPGKQLTG